jgi:hypothetical protein
MANNNKKKMSFGELIKSKKFRYGSLSVVFTAVTLAFIIGINLIITALNATHIFSIDMTAEEFYSISDTTVEYLEGLGDDFEITVHFCTARDRLEEYEQGGYNYFRMVHETVLAFAEKFPDNIEVAYFDVTTDPKYVNDIKHYTQTTLNASSSLSFGSNSSSVVGDVLLHASHFSAVVFHILNQVIDTINLLSGNAVGQTLQSASDSVDVAL